MVAQNVVYPILVSRIACDVQDHGRGQLFEETGNLDASANNELLE